MTETPPHDWRQTLRRRLAVMAGLFLLWSVAIEGRLVYLQVVRHDFLSARAERQQMRTVATAPRRGEIVDRRGHVLAYSVDAETVVADRSEIEDPARVVTAVCKAFEDCTREERSALTARLAVRRGSAYLRRQVTPKQAQRVAALDLQGVGFLKESRRFYPNKELAAHVLGFVGMDNVGLAGIEATYDHLIKGKDGTVLIQTDARRRVFGRVERPPTEGASLELTIDEYLQHLVERELRAGVEENRAAGGTAVVMDPSTGEVLAMANFPTFNPNTYGQATPGDRRNRAVQDLYEPGSTFKIVTASAALEEHVVNPDDMINVSGGSIRFGSRVIRDTHDYGVLSFTDAIVKSSNVGAIRVGLRLGAERLSDYVRRFGFGRRSSPDFPGETPGIVWDASRLTDSALASVSMGYQVGVTPLQMAAAVSAVANGGELVEPRVVRAVIRDGVRVAVPKKIRGRAIDADVAAELTAIMEQVVERGTATMVKMPGYTVAGKTGTAAKLVNGRYSRSDYNGSFVGFVPSRDPVFTIVVVIDSAHGDNGYYGGPVSGPVFRRIAEAALRYYGVAPTIDAPPPLLVARHDTARDAIPTSTRTGTSPTFTLAAAARANAYPDLRGMSARDAVRLLGRLGVTTRLRGSGVVTRQQPEAGSALDSSGTAVLWLERAPAAPDVSTAAE